LCINVLSAKYTKLNFNFILPKVNTDYIRQMSKCPTNKNHITVIGDGTEWLCNVVLTDKGLVPSEFDLSTGWWIHFISCFFYTIQLQRLLTNNRILNITGLPFNKPILFQIKIYSSFIKRKKANILFNDIYKVVDKTSTPF